jgi:hypothetical protein
MSMGAFNLTFGSCFGQEGFKSNPTTTTTTTIAPTEQNYYLTGATTYPDANGEYIQTAPGVWENVTGARMYVDAVSGALYIDTVSGGIGTYSNFDAFGDDCSWTEITCWSPILGVGAWAIDSTIFVSSTPLTIPSLELKFTDIANAHLLVGDATNVDDWNTNFNLPVNGNPFTSVSVVDNYVNLYGGSNIKIPDNLFSTDSYGADIISIKDNINSIVRIGVNSLGDLNFGSNSQFLVEAYFPALKIIDDSAFFANGNYFISLYVPILETLGSTTGDDFVFNGLTNNTFTITIPSLLNTDGDILDLINSTPNLVIINT